MGRGRKPSEFKFETSLGADLPNQLARFAVRSALMQHGPEYSEAVRDLASLAHIDESGVRRKLSVKHPTEPIDSEFVELVEQYLRDTYNTKNFLITYSAEIGRFSGLPRRERVELSHTWFIPLTNTGTAKSKPAALMRGWSAVAWAEHERAHGQLEERLDATIPGSYPSSVPSTFRERLAGCIEDLLTVTSMPAGQGHLAAAALLGRLGRTIIPHVDHHIRRSPVGWRAIRALTQALLYAKNEKVSAAREQLELETYEILADIHRNNYPTIYRARSFWEECADAMPAPRSRTYKGEYDGLIDMLIERATSDRGRASSGEAERLSPSAAPIRQRQTAAVVAFDRITQWREVNKYWKWDVERDLIQPLEESSGPSDIYPRETGLEYAAAFLRHKLDGGGDFYPGPGAHVGDFWARPEVGFVESVLSSPPSASFLSIIQEPNRSAAKHLVGASVLSVSGILRRRFLETLVAAGLGEPSAEVFLLMARDAISHGRAVPDDLRFIVENALFCASYMNTPKAIPSLMDVAFPGNIEEDFIQGGRSLRMTALMGIGDLAHLIRDDEVWAGLREDLIGRIRDRSFAHPDSETLRLFSRPELRAALHVLTMLRQDSEVVQEILGGILDADRGSSGRQGIWYRTGSGSVSDSLDSKSWELANWCRRRLDYRKVAFDVPDSDLISRWLISPMEGLDL